MNNIYNEEIIKGVFLIILALAGHFISQTLGCKTQKLLSDSMIGKHIIIIFIIYFTIGFVNSNKPEHPTSVMKMAIVIYILFLFFTKMNLTFTIIVFILLAISYVNYTFINYYNSITSKESNYEKNIVLLNKIQNILYITIACLIIIGFSLYFNQQYNDYYKTWSTTKFLFGVNKCKSM